MLQANPPPEDQNDKGVQAPSQQTGSRYPPSLLHAAARLYYEEEATQAQVAERLGTSRPTVSRLLSEARRQGIVRIEVAAEPPMDNAVLADATASALGLRCAFVATVPQGFSVGAGLAPALSKAMVDVGLQPDDVLLVSTGRTVYEAAHTLLPPLAGVRVAPTIGGHNESEPWYQPNEITRTVAARIGGIPAFLNAPALPGAELRRSLQTDESIQRVLAMWGEARCAVVGIGAPPMARDSLPGFVHRTASMNAAVGDVCSRFYDDDARQVRFPDDEQLLAISLEQLGAIPVTIAIAAGEDKVPALMAGAKAGYFNELVTDTTTATALLAAVDDDHARRLESP